MISIVGLMSLRKRVTVDMQARLSDAHEYGWVAMYWKLVVSSTVIVFNRPVGTVSAEDIAVQALATLIDLDARGQLPHSLGHMLRVDCIALELCGTSPQPNTPRAFFDIF